MQERSCYLEKSRKVAQKKDCCPDAETQRKAEQKKQTSRIADNFEKIRTKKRVLPLPDCAKCAKVRTKKRACCLFRDFRGPKRRCAPRSGRHPGRSGVPDVELLQNVAQKRGYPRTGGYPRHRPGSAGSLNRAKVCSKKRPVVPDRNGRSDVTF